MGESIGTIHQSNPLDFPQQSDKSSFFSLFSTDTEYKNNNTRTTEYLYQSKHVDDFNDEPCKASQPDYLCRRINLAPTQLHVTNHLKYSPFVLISVCVTVATSMFGGLKHVTKHAPRLYDKIKTCCEKRQRRTSTVELLSPEYTQM